LIHAANATDQDGTVTHDPGTELALRGVFGSGVWNATAATVVEDSADLSVLLVVPGCERHLAVEAGHMQDDARRWEAMKGGDWEMVSRPWSRTRVLWFVEPELYYSLAMFWDAATDEFSSYYVNFQVPCARSHVGFDTLDLDLDISVSPAFEWHWKDEEDWQDALASGALSATHIRGVEAAKAGAVRRIEQDRLAHLDRWLDWRPPVSWAPARLPTDWSKP